MTVSEEMTASAMSTHSMGLPSDAAAAADADVKSLELENGLLKSEIQSLNSEVTSLLQRVRQAESGKLAWWFNTCICVLLKCILGLNRFCQRYKSRVPRICCLYI